MLLAQSGSLLLVQGPGQRELRGAWAVASGLGGPKHRVGPDLLCGPQQPNHTVHRPAPTHHHQVRAHALEILPCMAKSVYTWVADNPDTFKISGLKTNLLLI